MLHNRRAREKRPHDGAPLSKQRTLTKRHGVVFQGGPIDHQQVALGAFNAVVDFEAHEALRVCHHAVDGVLDGCFKRRLLAGLNADVGDF